MTIYPSARKHSCFSIAFLPNEVPNSAWGVVSFAAPRSPEFGFRFRRVMGRGRIIEGDQPSLDPPPIRSFRFEWIAIFPGHLLPVRKAVRIHQPFLFTLRKRDGRRHRQESTPAGASAHRAQHRSPTIVD